MNLIEIKILYNADYQVTDPSSISTRDHIIELLYFLYLRPDVIRVSKTRIAEGGGDEDEQ